MLWEEYEEMIKESGRIEGEARGRKEGRVAESRETVFDFLKEKGEIPKEAAEYINAEDDPEILRKWVRLAAKADSVADFVAGYNQS